MPYDMCGKYCQSQSLVAIFQSKKGSPFFCESFMTSYPFRMDPGKPNMSLYQARMNITDVWTKLVTPKVIVGNRL